MGVHEADQLSKGLNLCCYAMPKGGMIQKQVPRVLHHHKILIGEMTFMISVTLKITTDRS